MKRILFLFAINLMAHYYAVAESILPFVQDGKVWSYYVTNFCHEWEETYSLEGDTTISSRKCVKLYYNQNLYQGAMFEEGGNVYIITPGSTTPALMYDFSSEPGTIINVGPFELRIKEKKLVKYHGEYLKVIYYSLLDPRVDEDFEGQWVDGIGLTVGSLTNLIDGYSPGLTGGERYPKTCTINGEVVYEDYDFYTSSQIVTGIMSPSVLPSNKNILYDLQGRQVGNGEMIMVNGKLPRGIYIEGGKKKVK